MNKMKIMVFFTSFLDMPADPKEGREAMCGLSVEYLFYGENGEQVESKVSVDGTCGTRRGKSFMDPAAANKVSFVPGIYDGTFEMSVDSKGRPMLKLTDIEFLSKASITAVKEKEGGK